MFFVFPVVRSSVIISSVSSTFAIVCHTSNPHSHSYFHWVFIRFFPHFGHLTSDSAGFGFSGKSNVISPSSVSLRGASNFIPVFETNPDITSVFLFVKSCFNIFSLIFTLATLPTIKRQLSGSSFLLFSHTNPNGATTIAPPHLGHRTSFTFFASTLSKSNLSPVTFPSSSFERATLASNFLPLFALKPRIVSVIPSFKSCFT